MGWAQFRNFHNSSGANVKRIIKLTYSQDRVKSRSDSKMANYQIRVKLFFNGICNLNWISILFVIFTLQLWALRPRSMVLQLVRSTQGKQHAHGSILVSLIDQSSWKTTDKRKNVAPRHLIMLYNSKGLQWTRASLVYPAAATCML